MAQLISGQPYSLKEIFCGDNNKVIIPDLQRDYCWGNPFSTDSKDSLVDSFMDSIFKLDKSSDITMGLIYGYYDNLMPYHLQLCDGQQRLTTLFLIIGVINRMSGDNRYRELLISDFELKDDDKEPFLLYGIRESSLYFLSDLTVHFFLNPYITSESIVKTPWFLNSYKKDPTINSIRKAIHTIETRLDGYEKDICELGDFIIEHLKFLFYDMNNRQNGEETFVVINTTGEPLTANQNLKPLIILANPNYQRIVSSPDGNAIIHDTANDWEEMETWFWQNRRRNEVDTSTEGMIAFLHCVRILESESEEEWHHLYETREDKFPNTITMNSIWNWFCIYKRVYELSYKELYTTDLRYPQNDSHYTQKELYSLLPTMKYCNRFHNVSDTDIQRIYHMFSNMAKYRTVNRSSQKEAIFVPAYRICQMVKDMANKDILCLLDVKSFDIKEEQTKLSFIRSFKEDGMKRNQIERLFAQAEDMSIYEGQIATLVNWSHGSLEQLNTLFEKILLYWGDDRHHDKMRRAFLAYGINHYPLTTGTANATLCKDTEWRMLFDKSGEQIREFIINCNLEDIIENYSDTTSSYFPLIREPNHLKFSQHKQIRVYTKGVIELMSKIRASADFKLFHNGCVFDKNMVDMKYWTGFWVWSDGNDSVFYTISLKHNLTLDMRILDDGYEIVAWTDRFPQKPLVPMDILIKTGFVNKPNGELAYPIIANVKEAKHKFIEITKQIIEHLK